ncbi:cAMP receptor protein [Rosistilla oblonga]|uniref:cAMP receptor protein n=1 Tax=Rosistilla oblonga TaxID=2527990 RepID=A0A518IU44_9BACT|nr:Crp/Fnr family transcriptional regulator [Rosistilla oblonga]QDV15233.1 cAMP receptor protein [Rosistilla oblonga]QDV56616.1 cAMP receptor protein [Rosistilla oblonga]
MPEKLWHLQNCDLFARLLPEQIERLETRCRSRSFRARSPVYLPSEKADSVFLLTKGLVKVCNHTPDGKQSILAFVEPGEMFGELALFADVAREEYVEAVEPTTVVMIPADALQQLMSQHGGVALAITKMVGLRRSRIERRLKNLLFVSNRDRLIHLLLDLAEQFGSVADDGIRLRISLAHQEIANLLGSTRETVTILLGQLRAEGFINVGRRKIVLTDPQRLSQSVQRKIPYQLLA